MAANLRPVLTWDETKSILTAEFVSAQDIRNLKTEFMALQFKGSLEAFADKFYILAQQLSTTNNLNLETAKATILSAVFENKALH